MKPGSRSPYADEINQLFLESYVDFLVQTWHFDVLTKLEEIPMETKTTPPVTLVPRPTWSAQDRTLCKSIEIVDGRYVVTFGNRRRIFDTLTEVVRQLWVLHPDSQPGNDVVEVTVTRGAP